MEKFRYVYDLKFIDKISTLIRQLIKIVLLIFNPPKLILLTKELFGSLRVHPSLKTAIFLDSSATYDFLIKERKGLLRWGDGDSIIVTNSSNNFEKKNNQLSIALSEIIKNYNSETSPYLLCVPIAPLRDNFFRLLISGRLSIWYRTRYVFNKYLNTRLYYVFGDAHMFRKEGKPNLFSFSKLIRGKTIILVHPSYEYYLKFEDLFLAYLKRVLYVNIPYSGAFEEYPMIIKEIETQVKLNELNIESLIILITAGNTARVLVDKLSRKYVSYDIGSLDLEGFVKEKDSIE